MTRPIVIFAAGFGTRMAPLTNTTPKPLIKVAGKALLDYALDIAQDAGTDPITVNSHYLANQITDHLEGSTVQLQYENPILETGGGLKRAAQTASATPTYTLNSDAIWVGENPLKTLEAAWSINSSALLLVAHVENVAGRNGTGDFDMDADGRLTRGGPWVYLGAQIVDPAWVTVVKHDVFSLNIVWDQMIEQGRLFGTSYPGQWCDVGRPENIKTAETLLAHNNV